MAPGKTYMWLPAVQHSKLLTEAKSGNDDGPFRSPRTTAPPRPVFTSPPTLLENTIPPLISTSLPSAQIPEAQDCVTPEDVMELVPSTPVLLLRFKPHAPEFETAALERFIELSCKKTPLSLELDMATRSNSILLPAALMPDPAVLSHHQGRQNQRVP